MSNVVATCYVVIYDDGILVSVEPTIYLTKPEHIGLNEKLRVFSDVFKARAYIMSHLIPGCGVKVEIAA